MGYGLWIVAAGPQKRQAAATLAGFQAQNNRPKGHSLRPVSSRNTLFK
jgi:hypothetical protein